MERQEISALCRETLCDGAKVTVAGWAKTIRDSKNIGFIELNDGSAFKSIQVVFEAEKLSNYKDIARLGVGASVKVTGNVVLTPEAKQ
ncbi:MAG: OB-fold nucleic acid binding domain-containing protein, partial [Oscillospiraceae bacterium]